MDALIVLALNSGSSSLKFGLYRRTASIVEALLQGETASTDRGVATILRSIAETGLPAPTAVGHRIVHGGPGRRDHYLIDDETLSEIERGGTFAPLHVADVLETIAEARSAFPHVPHVACLDTAFHKDLPKHARTLPLDAALTAGVERYGFHGLSCASIVHQFSETVPSRLIVAHLGSGASVTAIRDGRSIDTSMGMTPTGGMMMATRSGDLDPGVLLFLMRERGFGPAELENLLDRRSGLLGISGISSDPRELHVLAAVKPAARLAIAMFATAGAKQIATMMVSLSGADALVFTGGVGEHDSAMRAMIVERLSWAGLTIDPKLNAASIGRVEAEDSRVQIHVLPANEQEEIVRSVIALVAQLS